MQVDQTSSHKASNDKSEAYDRTGGPYLSMMNSTISLPWVLVLGPVISAWVSRSQVCGPDHGHKFKRYDVTEAGNTCDEWLLLLYADF